jgi:hypothetical protein
MLAEHPEVLRRLREEVMEKIGPNRRPEYDDLKEMKYLRAVINGKGFQAFFLWTRTYGRLMNRNTAIISCCVSLDICHYSTTRVRS